MRSFFAALVTCAVLLQGVHAMPAAALDARADSIQCCYDAVPLYRIFKASVNDHVYTRNETEVDRLVATGGYTHQGVTGSVLAGTEADAVPFFRLFSSSGNDHFYTTSNAEHNIALMSQGYEAIGVVAYVFPAAVCGSVPLYRMHNPIIEDNFHTANKRRCCVLLPIPT